MRSEAQEKHIFKEMTKRRKPRKKSKTKISGGAASACVEDTIGANKTKKRGRR